VPRYELKDGKSNKFWEIQLDGNTFTTSYGRIGTKGQTSRKEFKNPEKAQKEHDKLVASKVKKGYQPAGSEAAAASGADAGPAARQAVNPELQAALMENLDDAETCLVYADWLQTEGDPRGELITLQHSLAREDPKSAAAKKLRQAETELLAKHPEHFLPAKFAEMMLRKEPKDEWAEKMAEVESCAVRWQNGWLRSAHIARGNEDDDPHALEVLVQELLGHPSARLLQELTIGPLGIYDEYDYGEVMDAIIKARPGSVRRFEIANFWTEHTELSWSYLGDVSGIYRAMPRLEQLKLRGGSMTLGTINTPSLKSFAVETGGLSADCIKSICGAKWPNLESLSVYTGDEDYGAEGDLESLAPILEGEGIGKLRHLGLMNCTFTDEICRALPSSKILGQLETLDLSLGTMSDEGAGALAQHKVAFKHLKRIDLSENFLTDKGTEALRQAELEVSLGNQKEPYDWDEDGRYVSVGE
jgi:uncharacterized protein (TIGR02996 family)